MAKKRTRTNVGDVFCVEFGDGTKGYFQYLAKDECQLNSHVIRAFNKHYRIDETPSIDEIVDDDVAFYAHTVIGVGTALEAWEKIGNSKKKDIESLSDVIFGYTEDLVLDESTMQLRDVDPLTNWEIWKFGDSQSSKIGKLPTGLVDNTEPGYVKPYVEILTRMKYGYYRYTRDEYSVLKRRPRPEVHSYTRVEGDDVVYYFHFLGENVEEEIVVENGVSALLTPQSPSAHGHSLRETPFYATNWKHREFITCEEFEEAKSHCLFGLLTKPNI